MQCWNRIFIVDEFVPEERRKYLIVVIYDIVDKLKIWAIPTERKRCFLWQQLDLSKVLDQLLNFVLR